MPAEFRFPRPRPLDLIGFAWSPMWEALLSMRVVAAPKRTPLHLPWVRRCRELLTTELHDEIVTLIGPFDTSVPGIFEVGLVGDSPTFEADLAALRALDEQAVAFELSIGLGGLGCAVENGFESAQIQDPAYQADLRRSVADNPGQRELIEAVLSDPCALRDRYADLLARYWEAAFAEEWQRLLPMLEAEVTDGAHALVTKGPEGLVSTLLPEGRWVPETRSIVIDKDWDKTYAVGEGRPLLFVPTVYGWPRVLLEMAEPWPPSIHFPLRSLRNPQVPDASVAEVVDGFRALADETRLQIARLIADEPRSTRELSELLSLSSSAISRNLKILESAGLVTGRRDGYFVLYQLQPGRVDALGGALRHSLGMTTVGRGPVPALPVTVSRTLDRAP